MRRNLEDPFGAAASNIDFIRIADHKDGIAMREHVRWTISFKSSIEVDVSPSRVIGVASGS